MSWYKKSQQNISLNDITKSIDEIIVENITEEDIKSAFIRNGFNISGTDNMEQSLQVAAQVKTKTQKPTSIPFPATSSFPKSTQKHIINLLYKGIPTSKISREIGLDNKEVISFVKSIFPTKKDYDAFLKGYYSHRVKDILEEKEYKTDISTLISGENIAKKLGVPKSLIMKILNENGISLNEYVLERKFYIEDKVVEFVKSLPSPPPNIKKAWELMIIRMPEFKKLRYEVFRVALSFRNELGEWAKGSNTVFKAFKDFLQQRTNNKNTLGKMIAEGRIPGYVDDFINRYGKHFGFVKPVEKEMLKKLIITKVELQRRTEQYVDMGKFYNQYASGVELTKITNLLKQERSPQEIARILQIDLRKVLNIYQLYEIKNSPIETDMSKSLGITEGYE
jgi:hypothetical protein